MLNLELELIMYNAELRTFMPAVVRLPQCLGNGYQPAPTGHDERYINGKPLSVPGRKLVPPTTSEIALSNGFLVCGNI
jgi:hypothetical protein